MVVTIWRIADFGVLGMIVPQHRAAFCAEASFGRSCFRRFIILIKFEITFVLPTISSAYNLRGYEERPKSQKVDETHLILSFPRMILRVSQLPIILTLPMYPPVFLQIEH